MMKTLTRVHSQRAKQKNAAAGRVRAQRTLVCMMTACQMMLWVTFFGYDQSRQAVWQSALMLIVPGAAVYALWKKGACALHSPLGRYVPLALVPCLLLDAAFALFAISAFISQLMPQYPVWTGAAVPCGFALVTCVRARQRGVENGAYALKGLMVILFVFATVFLRASNRADRLWPLWGGGWMTQIRTAVLGAGCLWTTALLHALPQREEKGGARFAVIPWLAGCIWALWHGFVRPWSVGDDIAVAEKLMGLARHAHSVTLYEIAGLMWMAGLPLCLCGCTSVCSTMVQRAFPRCAHAWISAAFLVCPLVLVLFFAPALPSLLQTLLPWRIAVSLLCGLALVLLCRREARG